jgi:hypothetical protein
MMTTCAGCRYERPNGKCSDPCWKVGEQVTYDGPRLCWEARDPGRDPKSGIIRFLDKVFDARANKRKA